MLFNILITLIHLWLFSTCYSSSKGHFQELNKRLLISTDSYMRTTSPLHKETSQRLWQICADKGDIFLGKYEVIAINISARVRPVIQAVWRRHSKYGSGTHV